MKLDGEEYIDVGTLSHTLPTGNRTPRTSPDNILLGHLLEEQTRATGNEVEMLELPLYRVNEGSESSQMWRR